MFQRLAICACLLAAAAAQTRAADIVVSNGTDDFDNPPHGSLRDAVKRAKAGDTITFDANVKNVRLVGTLGVGATLRLQGPPSGCQITRTSAERDTQLVIEAKDVAVDGLTFFNCKIHADNLTTGLRVTNCIFSGEDSGIILTANSGVVIGTPGNKNTFHGIKSAIQSIGTTSVTIEANVFEGCENAVADGASKSIVIKDNTITGGTICGNFESGSITGNTIEATRGAGISIDPIESAGQLTISNNVISMNGKVDGIEVLGRGSLTVSGNTIGGKSSRAGITLDRGTEENDFDGTVIVTGNTVLGSVDGIRVDARHAPGPTITVALNTVGPVAGTGIFVRAFAPGIVQIASNIVHTAGKGTKGKGIAIQNIGGAATVTGNALAATLGTGLAVTQDSTLVTVAGNTIDGCTLHGISVGINARAAVADCVVKNVKGSGVFADQGAHVSVDSTSFGTTKGPEIDLGPVKATPNQKTKTANDNLDFPEAEVVVSGAVEGTTVPGGRVSLFAPGPGGLIASLLDATADAAGKFTIARGLLPAVPFRLLVHAPDDADVSELGPLLEPEPPDDGSGGDGEFSIELIAKAGTQYSPLSAKFGGFGTPVVNNSGVFAFIADLDGTPAIVRGGGPSPFGLLAQSGGVVPGIAGATFQNGFGVQPVLNDAGQVMFRAGVEGNAIDANNSTGIWLDTGGVTVLVARQGDVAPNVGNGVFRGQLLRQGVLGDQGRVAFISRVLSDSTIGDSVWVSGLSGLSAVALMDAPALGPAGFTYGAFQRVQLGLDVTAGAAGGVSFSGVFYQGGEPFSGLFYQPLGAAPGRRLLAGNRISGDALSGNRKIDSFQELRISVNDGASAFVVPGTIRDMDNTLTVALFDQQGVVAAKGDPVGGALIAVVGHPLPGHPLVAANGVTYLVRYQLVGGVTAENDTALLLDDGSIIVELAREGSVAPGTTDGAVFDDFGTAEDAGTRYQIPVVNRAGGYAFRARLRGNGFTPANRIAIYRGEPGRSPSMVARTGTPVVVGGLARVTPTALEMFDGSFDDGPSNGADGRGRSLSDSGTLAFKLDFDATSAIVFARPRTNEPKPDAILTPTGGGSPVGDDVYGGSAQVDAKQAAPGAALDYTITIQNDGTDPGSFTLLGPPDKAPFSITYTDAGSLADVTAAVQAGTWDSGTLAAGESGRVFASVRVAANAKKNTSATLSFVARSVADAKAIDTVTVKLKVSKP